MTEHISAERMHEIVDGAALSADAGGDWAHLESCAECRADLEALSGVVAGLRALPHEARAPDGLWHGIEARLEERAPADEPSDVVASSSIPSRRLVFTVPQLAAAAVVVSVLSAGTMWMALGGATQVSGPTVADATPEAVLSHASRAASGGAGGYESALAELEVLVSSGRDLLAPETLTALDESLRSIDAALEAVRAALQDDPSSDLLTRMLMNHQRSKLRVLRQAANSVQAQS